MRKITCMAFILLLLLPASGLAQDMENAKNEITVTTAEELVAALNDESVTAVILSGDAEVEAFLDGVVLTINKPLIVLGSLVFVGCTVRLEAQVNVKGELLFGEASFHNHGYVRTCADGVLGSYQSDIINYGAVYIEAGGLLECDRGGGMANYGVVVNEGTLRVTSNGGYASLQADSVLYHLGTLDVTSPYFYDYGATLLGDGQAVSDAVSPAE